MAHFDVLIVGGGIAGASLGARLAGRMSVAIIEAEEHCAMHSTGRSAAFWLAHYGGAAIIPLTMASRAELEAGWPSNAGSFLRSRGAVTIAHDYMDLRDALSVETSKAPRRPHIERGEIEALIPGLSEGWNHALWDESCADIDVAGLHNAFLAEVKRLGGRVLTSTPLGRASWQSGRWTVSAATEALTSSIIVNAAGAWADEVAKRCGVQPLGIRPYRRTVVQLRIGRTGLKDVPLVIDAFSRFYFKGESDNRIWVSPHDETPSAPCDAAPEEIDVARAVDHFQSVVDWPVETVERKWAGLRSFSPDRAPVFGFDPDSPGFFWCAGQGGFGIQTAPAASRLAASLLLRERVDAESVPIDPAPFAAGRFR